MKTEINNVLNKVALGLRVYEKSFSVCQKVSALGLKILEDSQCRDAIVDGIDTIISTAVAEGTKVYTLVVIRFNVDIADIQATHEELEEEINKAA